ncbi:hypothetical protein A3C96_02580 [Candidatus Uhrbacteria bacterium RIFCSPHIGHO2_02_FULL_60_10]|uniref:Uncharacterized protein n=1 Tax=Candidatus Uhrbacteria bacterium RIFCSPHIGHO2_02_FULL_60_10 TaxID=1802392 RepID=A0A1F7U2Q7_9BACT|nr:MAG: hypothetical protein A3C96_02580 [Candidatus Uhrbacteria bacterium RIFCSPHIGHO2_02_FULL_60_10]
MGLAFFMSVTPALAQVTAPAANDTLPCVCSCISACTKGLKACQQVCKNKSPAVNNPTCVRNDAVCGAEAAVSGVPFPVGQISIQTYVGNIIKNFLGLVGILGMVMFIYGGYMYMFSAGSAERAKKGQDIVVWTIIGMASLFISYAVVRLLMETLGAA